MTASTYATSQSYTYDNLYQLVKAEGTTKLYAGVNPVPEYEGKTLKTNKYCQDFSFDKIGNMLSKTSTTNLAGASIGGKNGSALNYKLDYEHDPTYAHRLIRAGERYYKYDANGNLTAEKDGAFEAEDDFTFKYSYFEDLDVYGVDYGFDLTPPKKDPANLAESGAQAGKKNGYRRDYEWNERNLLSRSRDREKTVTYRYGEDGERALKFCLQTNAETLYFNNFYGMQQVAHEPNHEQGLRVSKHIFVGNSRLVTALTHQAGVDTTEQAAKLYYYHADHLQSAQFITDANGEKYEHIEYTPYGELWIEETAPGVDKLPFRFTGKELDEETSLYYYGARYLDPKYSRWLSTDPALGEYIPVVPINDQAKKHNENLPGMGGVFNVVNLHVYHYAGNNPVKYTDPDGRASEAAGYSGNYSGKEKSPIQKIGDGFVNLIKNIGRGISDGASWIMENKEAIGNIIAGGVLILAGETTKKGGWALGVALAPESGGASVLIILTAEEAGKVLEASGGVLIANGANMLMANSNKNYREKTRGANKNDRKMINDAAREVGVDRREFGNFIEKLKKNQHRGSSDNFTYQELLNLAEEFKNEGLH